MFLDEISNKKEPLNPGFALPKIFEDGVMGRECVDPVRCIWAPGKRFDGWADVKSFSLVIYRERGQINWC